MIWNGVCPIRRLLDPPSFHLTRIWSWSAYQTRPTRLTPVLTATISSPTSGMTRASRADPTDLPFDRETRRTGSLCRCLCCRLSEESNRAAATGYSLRVFRIEPIAVSLGWHGMSSSFLVRAWIAAALAAGAFLVVIAVMYWALPAEQVPTWLPGHKPSTHPRHGHHHKLHGLIAFTLGFGFLSGAYLMSRDTSRRSTT
jgi:hypothetical protein